MRVASRLGLFSFNMNQIRQTWSFNRFMLLLGGRLRVADAGLTARFGDRRGSNEWELSSRIYRPWHVGHSRWRSDFSIDVILVAQHGRFGNMIRQLSLAIAVAERLGIREVLARSMPQFPQGTWVLRNGVTLTLDAWLRPRVKLRPNLVLGGDFFVRARLPIDVENFDFEIIGRSLLEVMGMDKLEPQDSKSLTIHFRSGDAFTSNPHRHLGQPPLAFYRRLLEYENPDQVLLVYEDMANPVISAVCSYLREVRIPFSTHSSSFDEDLLMLLSARTLVTSQGTMAEAILMLSPHVKRWIHFGNRRQTFLRAKELHSILTVVDQSGEYSDQILSGNWKNSESQRALMMTFPAEKLELHDSLTS